MLFDKDIEPRWVYCRYGTALGRDETACVKRGIMASSGSCLSFRYEPTKRVPAVRPPLRTGGLKKEDFSILP